MEILTLSIAPLSYRYKVEKLINYVIFIINIIEWFAHSAIVKANEVHSPLHKLIKTSSNFVKKFFFFLMTVIL